MVSSTKTYRAGEIQAACLHEQPLWRCYRVRGPLLRAALDDAFEELIRRHEILRTGLARDSGVLDQHVSSPFAFSCTYVDLRSLPASEQEAALLLRLRSEAGVPIAINTPPLFRAWLVQVAEESHILALTMHHCIADDATVDMFASELVTLYDVLSQGQPSPLPEVGITYGELIERERATSKLDHVVDHWRRVFGNMVPPTQVPADRPREGYSDWRHRHVDVVRRTWGPELMNDAMTVLKNLRVNPAMFTIAAYHCLLHEASTDPKIMSSFLLNHRVDHQLRHVFGPLVTFFPLQTDFSGDPTILDLTKQITRGVADILSGRLLEMHNIMRVVGGYWMQRKTAINLSLIPSTTCLRSRELVFEREAFHLSPTPPDRFEIETRIRGTWLAMAYDSDLFDRARIEALAARFEAIIRAAVKDPTIRVSELRDRQELRV